MKCRQTYNFIEYIDGSMPKETQSELENHLQSCAQCAEYLSIMKSSLSVIEQQKNIEINPFLYTRIRAKQAQQEVQHDFRVKRILQPAFVFTIVVFAVMAGYFIGNNYTQDISTSSSAENYSNIVVQEPIETALLNE